VEASYWSRRSLETESDAAVRADYALTTTDDDDECKLIVYTGVPTSSPSLSVHVSLPSAAGTRPAVQRCSTRSIRYTDREPADSTMTGQLLRFNDVCQTAIEGTLKMCGTGKCGTEKRRTCRQMAMLFYVMSRPLLVSAGARNYFFALVNGLRFVIRRVICDVTESMVTIRSPFCGYNTI